MSLFSENQRYAVEEIQQSLVLRAGAGAGKTRVLVHRYLQLLAGHASLDEIVAITFTNKAAGEMRDRIGEELLHRLQHCSNPTEAAQLQQWILLLPSATITTIHGFCSSILRQFPIEAQVDPNFMILEEWESTALMQKALTDGLEQALVNHEPVVSILLKNKSVQQAIDSLGSFLKQTNSKGVSLSQLSQSYQPSVISKNEVWLAWQHAVSQFSNLTFAFDKRGTTAIRDHVSLLNAIREVDLACFEQWSSEQQETWLQNLSEICERYHVEEGEKLSKNASLLRDGIVSCRIDEQLQLLWDIWLQNFYPSALRVLQSMQERFDQEKRKNRSLDFNDLEHKTLQLLRDHPGIVESLQRRYKAFLVDEFQDTNFSQFELIELLNRGRMEQSLFVAGDVKQSIYGFRGAVVELFQKMGGKIANALQHTSLTPHKNLETNYRSGAHIIQFVNTYFSQHLRDYEAMAAVKPANPDIPQLELILTQEASGKHFRVAEAKNIADRIQTMVTQAEPLVSGRPVRFGDVALLFRSRTDVSLYEAALKNRAIPYLVVGNRAFYQREEIQNLLHALAAIANVEDDFANWAWFTADYHGIPLRALAEHALACRKEKVSWLQHDWFGPKEAEERWQIAFHKMRTWQKLQAFQDVPSLLQRILEDCCLETYYAAESMGDQAWTNLLKLVALSKEASGTHFYGIHECLQYFHQLADEENEAELTLFTEGQDAVRVMTIHAAKGLEFPVLFLPDLVRKQDHPNRDFLVWHTETGMTLRNGNRKGKHTAQRLMDAEREESQRVLYVAMTRAKDYLVLCGGNHWRFKSGSWWSQIQEWLKTDPTYEKSISMTPPPEIVTLHGLPFHLFIHTVKEQEENPNPPNWELPEESVLHTTPSPITLTPFPGDSLHPEIGPLQQKILSQPRPSLRVSATGLLNYRRCPRNYYLRYRMWLQEDVFLPIDVEFPHSDRTEEEGNNDLEEEKMKGYPNALLFGSMVHKMCEWMTEEQSAEDVLALVLAEPMFSELREYGEEAVRLVRRLWQNTEFVAKLKSSRNTKREWSFLAPLSDSVFLEGVVDLLLEDENGFYHLYDYKTNQVKDIDGDFSESIAIIKENYRLQLQWYALAIEKLLNKPVVSAQLVLVRINQVIEIPLSPEVLNSAHKEALSLALSMETGQNIADYGKNTGKHCEYCTYQDICLNESERGIPVENHIPT